MSRTRRLAFFTLVLGLALAGCGVTPPVAVTSAAPTPTPSATMTSASPTPLPTPTPTPTTPSPTPTATEEPGANLTLRGDGLAGFKFGAKQADVAELLSDQLGGSDESSKGILCELDDSSPWAETVTYGGLWVLYTAKDQSKKSPRKLAAWGFSLQKKFVEPLAMQDGVPLNLNFKQLKAKYPAGKLESLNLGEGDGTRMFTLPNKIRFIGAGSPDNVSAGRLGVCE